MIVINWVLIIEFIREYHMMCLQENCAYRKSQEVLKWFHVKIMKFCFL